MKLSGSARFRPETLWKLPAGLSLFALLVFPFAQLLSELEAGSLARDGMAHLLALGVCAATLGLGLGVWIGVRVRRPAAVLAAVFSIFVALLWYLEFFAPMIEGEPRRVAVVEDAVTRRRWNPESVPGVAKGGASDDASLMGFR